MIAGGGERGRSVLDLQDIRRASGARGARRDLTARVTRWWVRRQEGLGGHL